MKLIKILPFVFLLSDACIERFEVPAQISAPRLVVDGLITDQPGPYTVKLFTSVDLKENVISPPVVSKAAVTIVDDNGMEEKLIETKPGIYQTKADGIQGIQGHKYYVKIQTNERQYQSVPQELTPAGNITDLYFTYRENALNPEDIMLPQDLFNIYLNAEGSPGSTNLFRWRWSSIYEIKTFPELRIKLVGKNLTPVPDPALCSGYTFNTDNNVLQYNSPCTCCNCWANEAGQKALISNNQFVDNNQFKEVNVAFLPIDKWRFSIKYYIKVEQLSLSEEVYAFWKLLKSQQEGEGSLFQPNAIKIKGNIYSVNDPNEEVLGIFGVSGVASKELYIFPKDVPKLMALDTVRESCQKTILRASNIKPPFW